MSLSVPFLTASVQVAGWHTPETQRRLWQSPGPAQRVKLGHGPQLGPPQSTSLSVPFWTPSPQPGAWQLPEPSQ
jgi:hypothetical protein